MPNLRRCVQCETLYSIDLQWLREKGSHERNAAACPKCGSWEYRSEAVAAGQVKPNRAASQYDKAS